MLPQHGVRSGIQTDLTLFSELRNQDKSDDGILGRKGSRSGHASEVSDYGRPTDKFRICLDPSNTINKATRVPKDPFPRFEDILPQLNGAKCFSVADAMSSFTNILLDYELNLASTFHTHFGRYQWLRLPYGVSSGPEEYQARQQEAFTGLKGICNIADEAVKKQKRRPRKIMMIIVTTFCCECSK